MNDQPKVTVYSTSTCPYCQQVKGYLSQKGVAFVDKNVGSDLVAREEMVKKSGQMAVPVIEINGKIIVGFNRAQLEEILS